MHTTYTMLVTIAHDDGAAPSTDLLDTMVKRGLEEGVREFAGVYAAEADSIQGEYLRTTTTVATSRTDLERLRTMRTMHAALRA